MRQRPGHVPGLSHFPEKRWERLHGPRSPIDAAKGSRSKGVPLEADVDVEGVEFVFHSRGGKLGAANARNMDGTALRLLLERISAKGLKPEGAWVDGDEARRLDRDQRGIFDGEDLLSRRSSSR